MSIPKKITVNCAKCGKPLKATVFDSVNTDYSKDIAQQIISGDLFSVKCPHCKFVNHLEYDILYHDMKHGAMVWVVHKDSPDYASKLAELRSTKLLPYKTMRVVEDMNALREKVSCLEHGRDDRVIELCKVFSTYNLLAQQPDFAFQNAFYTTLYDKEFIYHYDKDGNELGCELPENAYTYIRDLYYSSPYAKQFDNNYAIVDYAWAEEILNPLLAAEMDRIDTNATECEPEKVEEAIVITPEHTCPECKSELPEDSEFCQYCGCKLNAEPEEPASQPIPAASPVNVSAPEPTPVIASNQTPLSEYVLDDELGLVPNKPIYTNGPSQQASYLQSLRSVKGETINWNHRGSFKVTGIQGMVDVYDAYLPSGAEYKTVYLCPNGTEYPSFAPKGFSCTRSPHTTAATKQSRKKVKKHNGKKILIISLISVILAAVLAIGSAWAITEYRYQCAKGYLDSSDYDAAYEAFKALGNYRNSKELCEYLANLTTEAVTDAKYKDLQQAMQSVNSGNYKNIADMIDALPLDYRDVSNIKSEYDQIAKNIKTITSTSQYSRTEKSSTALRNAYTSLMKFDTKSANWGLSGYLEDVNDKYLMNLVFGLEWKTSDGTSFCWYEDENGDEILRSGLPNNEDYKKDYYYYITNPDKFGYVNKNDSGDKFLAYRITNVTYSSGKWQIKIYCYSNGRTYTLSPS